jgi:ABC-type uncharacterized transport system permease subunit
MLGFSPNPVLIIMAVSAIVFFVLIYKSLKLKNKITSVIVSLLISLIIATLLSFFVANLHKNLDEQDEEILNKLAEILNVEKESIKYLSLEGNEYNYGIKVGTKKYGINIDYTKDEIIDITEMVKVYKRGEK